LQEKHKILTFGVEVKKVLFISSVAGFLESFEIDNITNLVNLGFEVHVAANNFNVISMENFKTPKLDALNIKRINIPFTRFPISIENIKGFYHLFKLNQAENFFLIDCHTPTGGVVGRLLGWIGCVKEVFYTAHGFHFYKGAGKVNWLLYYPIEYLLSFLTTTLITINEEDFLLSKKNLKARNVIKIPGVGLDTAKFRDYEINNEIERVNLKIKSSNIVLLSVGELSARKNHQIIIKALGKLNDKNIIYLIVGEGGLLNEYVDLIKQEKLERNVLLLGVRNDIPKLCKIADIFVHPSIREGLGIAALEGMASGLPLIVSDINGIKDYAKDNITGMNVSPFDQAGFALAIKKLSQNSSLRKEYGDVNQELAKKFDQVETNFIMNSIYQKLL
jgi:glycosyltransferase involved in cell wall biosynthesis